MYIPDWYERNGIPKHATTSGSIITGAVSRSEGTVTIPAGKRGMLLACTLSMSPEVALAGTGYARVSLRHTRSGVTNAEVSRIVLFENASKINAVASPGLLIPLSELDTLYFNIQGTMSASTMHYSCTAYFQEYP